MENLVSPEFDPRSVQPVAGRYTDYAIKNVGVEARECPCGLPRPLHRLGKRCFRYVFSTPRKLGHDMDDMIAWNVGKESWK